MPNEKDVEALSGGSSVQGDAPGGERVLLGDGEPPVGGSAESLSGGSSVQGDAPGGVPVLLGDGQSPGKAPAYGSDKPPAHSTDPPPAYSTDPPPAYGSDPSSAYSADPSRIQAAMRGMNAIKDDVQAMLKEFEGGVSATRGWTGKGDSFARESGPLVDRQDGASGATVGAVAAAIAAAVEGTEANVTSIQGHQGDVLDAIGQEARRTGSGGRH
ncbi:hypothetical protein [Streptomyces sp. NPDC020681]|uniref:hypothetical protein n=1 Tax=Streptomyces sp. NPDC020681 TaxID=3365083 RepID=UPI0037990352